MWEVRLQGKDRSDGHGCPNAADAGMRRSGPTIRLHFHHCTWTWQVPRSTGRARAAIPGGQTQEGTTPGKEGVDRVGNSGREQRTTPWQGLFLTILLHFRHPWRSDGGGRTASGTAVEEQLPEQRSRESW